MNLRGLARPSLFVAAGALGVVFACTDEEHKRTSPDEAVANARATARARLESLADDVRTALDLPSS